jgi:hypothetical protein
MLLEYHASKEFLKNSKLVSLDFVVSNFNLYLDTIISLEIKIHDLKEKAFSQISTVLKRE